MHFYAVSYYFWNIASPAKQCNFSRSIVFSRCNFGRSSWRCNSVPCRRRIDFSSGSCCCTFSSCSSSVACCICRCRTVRYSDRTCFSAAFYLHKAPSRPRTDFATSADYRLYIWRASLASKICRKTTAVSLRIRSLRRTMIKRRLYVSVTFK